MGHWLLDAIAEQRERALSDTFFYLAGRGAPVDFDLERVRNTAAALEFAVLDLKLNEDKEDNTLVLRKAAADAFYLLQALPMPSDPITAGFHLLRVSSLAILGGQEKKVACWLLALKKVGKWPVLPLESKDWGERCRATAIDAWLRLIRRHEDDRQLVVKRASALKEQRPQKERDYLRLLEPAEAKRRALELIALYHLIYAAQLLAEGHSHKFDEHFHHAITASGGACLGLEPLVRLLFYAVRQIVVIRVGGSSEQTGRLVVAGREYPIPVTGADAQRIEEETGVPEHKIWAAIDEWSSTPCEYWRGCGQE